MTDTFLRQDFAIKNKAKQTQRGQECFSENERGLVEPPRGPHLEGRATSKSEISEYLVQRRKERKRAYRRKYMRAYRSKQAKENPSQKPYAGLTAGDWDAIWKAQNGLQGVPQTESHA